MTMLKAACPDTQSDVLAGLSIGGRDAGLLAARARTFGDELAGLVSCPSCNESLELTVETTQLQKARRLVGVDDLRIETGGFTVTFRLPTSVDLFAIDRRKDAAANRLVLLARCVLSAEHDGAAIAADRLPEEIVELVAERMGEVDAQADVQVPLSCASCGHTWLADFDIGSFLWREIETTAVRLLDEVHTLASVYGWREADILALSAPRRHAYLQMIGA
jgi:hypothetical protein